LDEFELEFLNFSKGYKDIDVQDSKDVRTTSFQYLMSDLLLVKQVKNAINADDYVAKLANNQMSNIGNVINTFLIMILYLNLVILPIMIEGYLEHLRLTPYKTPYHMVHML
jgi:hypothetical protein